MEVDTVMPIADDQQHNDPLAVAAGRLKALALLLEDRRRLAEAQAARNVALLIEAERRRRPAA
jgi:hypothetical protein